MGGHGRAGGKRKQAVGGGGEGGRRTVMPVQQKKRQLGLPELGDYSRKMQKVLDKQHKRNEYAMDRIESDRQKVQEKLEEARRLAQERADDGEAAMEEELPQRNMMRGQLAAMMLNASSSCEQFEARQEFLQPEGVQSVVAPNRSRENSKKRFWKEFQKVVKVSDVLLEVLDARDPLGCRLQEVERTIESQFEGKKRFVLVLNKVDLVPRENIEKWLEYFRLEGLPVVAFSAAGGGKAAAQETSASKDLDDPTHRCVHNLFEVLRGFQRTEAGGRRLITVGIIGFPNVGKSSVINALKRQRVVGTGNTPGVTTAAQEVHLQGHIKIVDCPGVVISDASTAETALRNAAKIEHLDDVVAPTELIFKRCGLDRMRQMYGLPPFLGSFDEIIAALAEKKGKLLRGRKPNVDDTCKVVLKDWNDGKIPYFTMPPQDRELVGGELNTLSADQVQEEKTVLAALTAQRGDFVTFESKPHAAEYRVDGQALFSQRRRRDDGTTEWGDATTVAPDDYDPFRSLQMGGGGAEFDTAGGFVGEDEDDRQAIAEDDKAIVHGDESLPAGVADAAPRKRVVKRVVKKVVKKVVRPGGAGAE